jgi:(2S)-methylsuccinyl-CoA dehydrogenase
LLQSQVDLALQALQGACTENGRFNPHLLDRHQLVAYELAFCAAELAATDAIDEYASRVGDGDELVAAVTQAASAELLQSVCQRLQTRASAMGLAPAKLAAVIGGEPLAAFLQQWQSPERLAAIGETILARGEFRLPTGLDEEKEMVRSSFARFSREAVEPVAAAVHRQDLDVPESLIEAAAALGCFGSSIPQRYAGLQPDDRSDSLSMIVITEELSRASLGAAGSLVTRPEIAARALLAGGTQSQCGYWLPRLARAESLAAIAVTEPDCGSDVAAVTLRATPTAGGWLLDGSKTWCTFAGRADLLLTLARTGPEPGPGHRGLSLFLVEKPVFAGHEFQATQADGGQLTGRAIATLGYRGMHSYDLHFDNYFVPDAGLLGDVAGRGFYHIMAGFAGGRIQTAARATGVMQAAFDQAAAYAAQRRVFGAPVGDYQLTRVKLARMLSSLTAARQFSYSVARLLDDGGGQMEASLVKLFSCRAAEWVTREAMQIHGGMGYAEETSVSRYFVDARVLSIFEGAEETLALKVIARELVAGAGGR